MFHFLSCLLLHRSLLLLLLLLLVVMLLLLLLLVLLMLLLWLLLLLLSLLSLLMQIDVVLSLLSLFQLLLMLDLSVLFCVFCCCCCCCSCSKHYGSFHSLGSVMMVNQQAALNDSNNKPSSWKPPCGIPRRMYRIAESRLIPTDQLITVPIASSSMLTTCSGWLAGP